MRFDLRHAVTANWPIKLLALALATVLWAAVSAEEPTTQLVPVRLDIQIPPNRALVQEIPQVQALYGGPARELIKLYSSPPFVMARVPDTLIGSRYAIDLAPQNVTLLTDADVVIQDLVPRRIVVVLDSLEQRPVPVIPRVTVTPDTGYVVAGRVRVRPDSVMVIGPRAQVERIGNVYTTALSIDRARVAVRQSLTVDTSGFGVVRLSQTSVEIEVPVDAISERTIVDVPVLIGGGTWLSTPAGVALRLRGPTSRLARLTRDSLLVTGDLPLVDSAMVAIRIQTPPGITATAVPDSVRAQRLNQ